MSLLWNYFYLWGPMFMDCQNVAGLWGRHFVGNWFVALQCKTFHYFVRCPWGCKYVGVTTKSTNIDSSRTMMIPQLFDQSLTKGPWATLLTVKRS